MWDYVTSHFNSFLTEIELRASERIDAERKADQIARSLAAKYYPNQLFNTSCYLKVGSYGKGTACRPRSDLDMLFILPDEVLGRFLKLQGNQQSQLLREVKEAVQVTFSNTSLRADGQVVIADFKTYQVDIVPAFNLGDGMFVMAHTKNDGRWGKTDPIGEARNIKNADELSVGKATNLNKMIKVWKRTCSVDIKSIFLEMMVNKFVSEWQYRHQTIFYYDWMMRDFFAFMLAYINGTATIQGSLEVLQLGVSWESKCRSAYQHALKACEYEHADKEIMAAFEWKKIFGDQFKANSNYLATLVKPL